VLVGLGPDCYLEIVGVDEDQPEPTSARWFGLDRLRKAGLVTWAVKADHLDEIAVRADAAGIDLGRVTPASRRRPDGGTLSWTFTDPLADRLDGVVPFFIDWGETIHPAASQRAECSLEGLRAEHPEPERARAALSALDVELRVDAGPRAALIATLRGPGGRVELR
jgi:hypothetical protein